MRHSEVVTEQQPYEVVAHYPGFELRWCPEHVIAETRLRGSFVVSFAMPARSRETGTPEPADPRVRVRSVPAQLVAAKRFSGRWSRGRYDAHASQLLHEVAAAGLRVDGPLRFARFDPPWTPWFRRRNEVVVPVAARALASDHGDDTTME